MLRGCSFAGRRSVLESVLEAQLEWRRDSMSEEVRIWVSELRGCSVERM